MVLGGALRITQLANSALDRTADPLYRNFLLTQLNHVKKGLYMINRVVWVNDL